MPLSQKSPQKSAAFLTLSYDLHEVLHPLGMEHPTGAEKMAEIPQIISATAENV